MKALFTSVQDRPRRRALFRRNISKADTVTRGNQLHGETLYRDNPWWQGEDYIGFTDVPRSGFSGVRTWSSVGNGDYYFTFSKANDGVRITSNDVHMFSQ